MKTTSPPPAQPAGRSVLIYLYLTLLALIGWFVFQYVFDKKLSLTGDATDYYILIPALTKAPKIRACNAIVPDRMVCRGCKKVAGIIHAAIC